MRNTVWEYDQPLLIARWYLLHIFRNILFRHLNAACIAGLRGCTWYACCRLCLGPVLHAGLEINSCWRCLPGRNVPSSRSVYAGEGLHNHETGRYWISTLLYCGVRKVSVVNPASNFSSHRVLHSFCFQWQIRRWMTMWPEMSDFCLLTNWTSGDEPLGPVRSLFSHEGL